MNVRLKRCERFWTGLIVIENVPYQIPKLSLHHLQQGIGNLTRIWQNGQHENQNTQVPRFLFSLRNYRSRRLALLSILPQPP